MNIEAMGSLRVGRTTVDGRRSGGFSSRGGTGATSARIGATFVCGEVVTVMLETPWQPSGAFVDARLSQEPLAAPEEEDGGRGGQCEFIVIAGTELVGGLFRLTVVTETRSAKLGEVGGSMSPVARVIAMAGLGRPATGYMDF